MGQLLRITWGGVCALSLCGCVSGPLLENPVRVGVDGSQTVENPLYVPLGPTSNAYGLVFEKVLDIVDDDFEIAVENRYEGRIETFPRIAPGLEQLWKGGDPDFYQRLEATLQSIRHRAVIHIQPANNGGYFVQVTVYKELEDLPRPSRSTAGAATFRTEPSVERQFEVIDPTVFESTWIPRGRDLQYEQVLLRKIKKCL